ncbi:MAG TPA: hypothetical protein VMM76_01675 [Pirellulaceae bacterium]|nr:hypothetical protein [Pirellulaceae bacterium]
MRKVMLTAVVGVLASFGTQTAIACGLFHCRCHHHQQYYTSSGGGGGRNGEADEEGARGLNGGKDAEQARSVNSRDITALLTAANLILNTFGSQPAAVAPAAPIVAAPAAGPATSLIARVAKLEENNANINATLKALHVANQQILAELTAINNAVGVTPP